MKNLSVVLFGVFSFLYLSVAFAADGVVPDLLSSIMLLWKAIQENAGVAIILVPVFQILRTNEFLGVLGKLGLSGNAIRISIAVITALGYIVDAAAKGENLGKALITGLFTSGGAMLIYDAIRAIRQPST